MIYFIGLIAWTLLVWYITRHEERRNIKFIMNALKQNETTIKELYSEIVVLKSGVK